MVRQFKGIVEISDVQAEFDNLVNAINSMIKTYNESAYVQDINYNDVSEELAPLNYTLSVGGLKKILDTYDGCVIGCKVFQLNGYVAITNGLLITANGGIKLPAAKINTVGDYLFFSPSLNQYKTDDGYKYTYTSWTQPNFTSSETWGTVTSEGYYKSTQGATYGISNYTEPFKALSTDTNGWISMAQSVTTTPALISSTLKWKFRQLLKVTNINLTLPVLASAQEVATVNIKNYSGSLIKTVNVTSGVATNISLDGTELTGIAIEVIRNNKIMNAISKVVLTAQIENKEPVNGNAGDATDWIAICKINNNRNVALSNTQDFTIGEISDLKIGSQSKNVQWRTYEGIANSSIPQFVSGVEGDQKEGTGRATTYLCGQEVAWNEQTGHRNSSCWTVYNKLLVPKKVPNPYTYAGGTRTDMTKIFNVVQKRG